ncbi:MAG: hypothetical protein GX591_20270 [Planctomycetes bacterium]|nr:hypothetical protein [Planctomycetota bacterium]
MLRISDFRPQAALFLAVLLVLAGAGCHGQAPAPAAARPLAHPAVETPWSFGGVEGRQLTSRHYNVLTTTAPQGVGGTIVGFLEAARAYYVDLTGLEAVEPDDGEKLVVYLFRTRQEWAALTEQITGQSRDTVLKVRAGGYCYRGVCVFWDLGTAATYSVAAHEGLHQFLGRATIDPLPHWVEEGLAVLAEGFRIDGGLVTFEPSDNAMRVNTLRNALLGGRWRSAGRLAAMTSMQNLDESPFNGGDYYAQVWAMLLLIRSDASYTAGLRRMCRDAADGTLADALGLAPLEYRRLQRDGAVYAAEIGPRAFRHYIDSDLDRFERRYIAFARQLARLPAE